MATGIKEKRRMSHLGGSAAFSDESRVETLKSKVIIYPKFLFRLGLECDRSLDCYIVVKTKILDDVLPLGCSETRNYQSESSMYFTTAFEVLYQVGIDDDQVVLFDIFDGDVLSLREGYLFSSLSIPVSSLSKGEVSIPITRGQSILGYLYVNAELDVFPTNCTLDLTNDYHTAFFKVPRLSVQDIKNAFPQMVDVALKYNLHFNTYAVYRTLKKFKIDAKKNEYLKTFMRICVCEHGDLPDYEDLRLVWESNPVTKAPYEVGRKELQLRHDSILGDIKTMGGRSLVFQVYADGYDLKANSKPKLLLFTSMPLLSVLASKPGGVAKSQERHYLQFQSNVEGFRSTTDKKRSLFEKLDFLHHDASDADSLDDEFDEGNDSGDREPGDDDEGEEEEDLNPLHMVNNALKIAQDEIGRASGAYVGGGKGEVKSPKKDNENKSVFGKLKLEITPSEDRTNLENGDASYEEKIRVIYEKRSQEWTDNVRALFNESVEEQTENTLNSTENLECRIDGAGFALTILADIHTPAVVDLVSKLQLPIDDPLQRSLNATFFGSAVLESIEDIAHKFTPFLDDDKIQVYAVGTVSPPSKEEGSPYEYAERTVSFPLGQELLLSALNDGSLFTVQKQISDSRIMSHADTLFSGRTKKDFRRYIDPLNLPLPPKKGNGITSNTKSQEPRKLLESFLQTSELTAFDELAYFRESSYGSSESIRVGFAESTGCYCPAINTADSLLFVSADGALKEVDEQEKKKRLFREKQYKYRLHACYTGNFIDSSALPLGEDMFKVLANAYDKVENFDFFVPSLNTLNAHNVAVNFDADVLELLLFDPSYQKTSVSQLIVWVVGKCPGKKVLDRLEIIFQRIMFGETTRPLLIYLACEPILELTSNNLENVLSNQFAPLFEAFDKAFEDGKLYAADLKINKQLLKPKKFPCKSSLYRTLGNKLTIYHNISFSEVLATAFIRDDEQNNLERSDCDFHGAKEGEGDDFANLPRYTILRETLGIYFDKKTTSNIIGKATLSIQESDNHRRHSMRAERESLGRGSVRRSSILGSRGSILGSRMSTIAMLAKTALGTPGAAEETEEERNAKEDALRIKKHEEEVMAARVPDMHEIQTLSRAFKKFQNIGNSTFMKAFTASILKELSTHVPSEAHADSSLKQRTCQPLSAKGVGCIVT